MATLISLPVSMTLSLSPSTIPPSPGHARPDDATPAGARPAAAGHADGAHHDPAHGHGNGHAHSRSAHSRSALRRPAPAIGASVLRLSLGGRLGLVAILLAILWTAVLLVTGGGA